MIPIGEIRAAFPYATVKPAADGGVLFSYPTKSWVDVPTEGDIRSKSQASTVVQYGASGGQAHFLLKP